MLPLSAVARRLNAKPPSPTQKGRGGDGGEPITGQAALIVWLNSWLIEWEMELGVGRRGGGSAAGVCACVGRRGSIKPWPCAIPASAPGTLAPPGAGRALILGGQPAYHCVNIFMGL